MLEQICGNHWCQKSFTVSDEDLAFLEKVSPVFGGKKELIPPPHLCPSCSAERRFAFRNEWSFHKRTCDKTGERIVSIYAPDSPYTVYKRDVWFSDAYDPLAYGRPYDPTRSFFDQLQELSLVVPYEHMVIINSENCEYCNMVVNSKNCYLSVRVEAEDCAYCYLPIGPSRDCFDCHTVNKCEMCYECIDCSNCFTSKWCEHCKQCTDCAFCIDCIGCQHCFNCIGLQHKEYHIENQPYSKEDYEREMAVRNTASHARVLAEQELLATRNLNRPQRFASLEQSEVCTGDYIVKSRNVRESFDIESSEDVASSYGIEYSKDVARSSHLFHGELSYEHLSCTFSQNVRFSYGVYNSHDIDYCMMVHNGSHDCFGCIGLKQNSYCILNKQYSKEEYARLVPQIIEKMKSDGEYGEFFPPSLSHFGYNETFAAQVFGRRRAQVMEAGFVWKEVEEEPVDAVQTIDARDLPDCIDDIPDDILQWGIRSEQTGKPFRLIRKELDFYRTHRIPVPRLHPTERHLARAGKRRPQQLWNRTCGKCSEAIQTTYAPDRPEIVYCEKCYLATVY